MTTTILVVEDEALIAADIQRTLKKLGYDVPLTVGTGAGALEAVARAQPGLVLMDIKLRGPMDGIETAEALRALVNLPIVYLTSHSDEATLSRAMETDPSGYLLKPFSDRELRTAIEVALNKHELESRLAARERWFATTLRSIGDAVIAADPHGVITFMNVVAEALTGWGAEAVGRPLDEVFRIVAADGTPMARRLLPARGDSFTVELPAQSELALKAGGQISVDDSASAIKDDKGRILGSVIVFRDVTERRKLEERLARSERLASLGTMAAGIGHEINNPLTYVVSNVAMAREALPGLLETLRGLAGSVVDAATVQGLLATVTDLAECLQDAADGGERVRRIVLDLKKLTRAEPSQHALLDLPNVLEASIKMTDHAVRHHARVRKVLGTTPYVEADDGPLGQIFTNLLINAAEAIGDGAADKHEITVTTFTDASGRAVVEIRDTGPGIPSEVMPRIFEPFFTTKPVGRGTGLGLSICHSLIAGLDGQLTAENVPGGGALFRVVLPPARRAEVVQPVTGSEVVALRRGRVLVIDDEAAVASALSRMLRSEHDVTTFADGREALARIAAGDVYDIIFCDLMMPTISGIDIYQTLRDAGSEHADRIVFMTGGTFTVRSQAFLDSSTNVCISKPFAAASVRAIAREHVK